MNKKLDKTKKTILIADSCACGIIVLKNLSDKIGEYNVIFLADGEMNPFGLKSKKEIINIVDGWLRYFNKISKLTLLVVACNTASIAINSFKNIISKKYNITIITMVDLLKLLLKDSAVFIGNRNIGVLGTKYTINSGLYFKLIKMAKPQKMVNFILTESEAVIARGQHNTNEGKNRILKNLKSYKEYSLDGVLLGCTCFCFIQEEIKIEFGKNLIYLDPGNMITEFFRQKRPFDESNKKLENVIFYTTGEIKEWSRNINSLAKIVFGQSVKIRHIKIR